MRNPENKALKQCIDEIIYRIDYEKKTISNRQLIERCRTFGDSFKLENDPHIFHEVAETAINFLIKEKFARELLSSNKPTKDIKQTLFPLYQRLPTQTWRSETQIIRQQFSTPPLIAFLLSYLLNLKKTDVVLEPSAGTGGLAVWASGLGLKTFTNEIDARRCKFLKFLNFNPTSFNAEYIHDYLSLEIKPNVLLMNPPFSSDGGKTKNNSSKIGFRHAASALERLEPGGKFGIILGSSASFDTRMGKKFWQELSTVINLDAIIKISGREYYKYGTSVDVNLCIGTKYPNPQEKSNSTALNAVKNISIDRIEEGFGLSKISNLRLD